MAIFRGISYLEKTKSPMSPVEAIGNNMSQADKTYLLAWDQASTGSVEAPRQWAAMQILGYPTAVRIASNLGGISRVTPMPHPEWVDSNNRVYMYATSIPRIQPVARPADGVIKALFPSNVGQISVARYLFAEATIRFETLTYDVREDRELPTTPGTPQGGICPDESSLLRYVTRAPQAAGEYLSLPYGAFKYVGVPGLSGSSAPPVPGQPGKIVPTFDLKFTWHQIPKEVVGTVALNPDQTRPAIDLCLGRVNSVPFAVNSSGGGGYPAGTLLCMSPNLEPIRSSFGDRLYNITYNFKYFPYGWNFIYRAPAPSGYYEVSSTGFSNLVTQAPGINLYDYADFNILFRPTFL